MKPLISTAMLLLVGLFTLGGSLFAQSDPRGDTGTSNLSSADKHFVKNAAEGGLAEVELGQLAENKASNQQVKEFGQKMVEDHSKANEGLKDLAQKLGISIPDHMSATQMAQKAKLRVYSGAHFDRAYMADMLKDHREDIAAFKREATSGHNHEIRAFASKKPANSRETLTACGTSGAQGRRREPVLDRYSPKFYSRLPGRPRLLARPCFRPGLKAGRVSRGFQFPGLGETPLTRSVGAGYDVRT